MKAPMLTTTPRPVLAAVLHAACGGDSGTPEERLEAAGGALEEAREDADADQNTLPEAQERRLGAAEAELYNARKTVRAAEKAVLSAKSRLTPTRESALQIARSTPGVSVVRDRLDVEFDEAS